MKTIGLIGGSTWHSTVDYYSLINQEVNNRLGGDSSARIIINSVNFKVLTDFNKTDDWEGIENYISSLCIDLEKAGAECILLGANTLHKITAQISQKINIPIIHIVEETAKAIQGKGLKKVALLGTNVTMTDGFYQDILSAFGIETLLPKPEDMNMIHNSIYGDFSKGIFTSEMKSEYLRVINYLKDEGAEGVILGCTEIPILIKADDVDLSLFNTTKIHINAAIEFSLS